MPQEVWAFLASKGDAWSVGDLCGQLAMPESTVRNQLKRLVRRGLVVEAYVKTEGRYLYWAR